MRCLVGVDDTDSSAGLCTTYLAFRIACSSKEAGFHVLAYPRLVRLNPNVPFKTRGNAAVCLSVETDDPRLTFERICAATSELSDVKNGANSGVVFLEDLALLPLFGELYTDALKGLVNSGRVERLLKDHDVKYMKLGNGMGIVGASCALAFDERLDHTYEIIAYRRKEFWGSQRVLDASSVLEMDRRTFPHTFNNYDYQKRKVLIAPHGPDPVFAGIRGDSPETVLGAFKMLQYDEPLEGHMVYLSNQHTEAHLEKELDWKGFSSGWCEGEVITQNTGVGRHVYVLLESGDNHRSCAVYEPTGDLRRAARMLVKGDRVRFFGGVRRGTSIHPKVLNVEKMQIISLAGGGAKRTLVKGTYVSSPRANRHLTKPFVRLGNEAAGELSPEVNGWLQNAIILPRALARGP